MDSRERVLAAVDRRVPDRVPVDFWCSAGLERKLEAQLGLSRSAFLDRYDVDLRYIDGPDYVGPPFRELPDGSSTDLWGVGRRLITVPMRDGTEQYREVSHSPLAGAASVEAVEGYPGWPDPDWFDYRPVRAQCEAIRRQGRAVVFMGDRLNRIAQLKPAMYLRGVEQILIDLALNPEIAQAVFDRIARFYLAYEARILEAADGLLDLVLTGDDFGTQNGPFMSPPMWEQFLGDNFAAFISLAHSAGVRVIHHTCGAVRPLIPLLVARGLDVLQSLQPEAAGMDPAALKAEFGDVLSFHGGISIQKTLPFGTPDEIRREVRSRVRTLAPGGGYILCTSHNIQADVPLPNVLALLDAYREFA